MMTGFNQLLYANPLHKMDNDTASTFGQTFTRDDIEAAKAASHEQGYEKGMLDAKECHEAQLVLCLTQLEKALNSWVSNIDHDLSFNVRVLNAALKKLFPTLSTHLAEGEIMQMLGGFFSQLNKERLLCLHVHPQLLEAVEKKLQENDVWKERFSIKSDETMAPSDCRISWPEGEAMRNSEDLLTQLEKTMLSQIEHSKQS